MANFNLIDRALGLLGIGNRKWLPTASYMLGQKGAVWIDVNKPYEMYNTIPQLKGVIDRKASMFSNMVLKIVDEKTGEERINDEIYKLLQNPNALQSFNEWLVEAKTQEQVYGNLFILKNQASKLALPQSLWNVSSRYVKPILTGNLFDQVKAEDIIKGFEYDYAGKKLVFEGKNILYFRLKDLDNPIVGTSPILSLKYPLSNTFAAYEYLNVISTKKGAIGMMSNESKDAMGAIPLSPEDKKKIEGQYINNYGIAEEQSKVILTEAALKWTPMTYPTKDLLLMEQIDANTMTIIDHFGLNVNIFSSKNATFENVKQGILLCYQDTIQPEADRFAQGLGKFLNLAPGTKLTASYEHLSIMKENKQRGLLAVESLVRTLTQAVQAGLIQAGQATNILQNELIIQTSTEA